MHINSDSKQTLTLQHPCPSPLPSNGTNQAHSMFTNFLKERAPYLPDFSFLLRIYSPHLKFFKYSSVPERRSVLKSFQVVEGLFQR